MNTVHPKIVTVKNVRKKGKKKNVRKKVWMYYTCAFL